MKNPRTRDWLMDSLIVSCLTGIAIYLLPVVSAWFVAISLRLGRSLFWVHSIALGDLLPHIIVGGVLGLLTAWLIRRRALSVALLPAVLLCTFYGLYFSLGSYPHSWGYGRHDLVLVCSWLLLIIASLFCARFVLQRRAA